MHNELVNTRTACDLLSREKVIAIVRWKRVSIRQTQSTDLSIPHNFLAHLHLPMEKNHKYPTTAEQLKEHQQQPHYMQHYHIHKNMMCLHVHAMRCPGWSPTYMCTQRVAPRPLYSLRYAHKSEKSLYIMYNIEIQRNFNAMPQPNERDYETSTILLTTWSAIKDLINTYNPFRY